MPQSGAEGGRFGRQTGASHMDRREKTSRHKKSTWRIAKWIL